MYDLLPRHLYPSTFNVLPTQLFSEIAEAVTQNKIAYPLIVKPEIGGQGILFRKIDNEEALKKYHAMVPVQYIVQQMVNYPVEVSVFHIKHPAASTGIITGFLHKIPLHVIGDGVHTLQQLIMENSKAAKRLKDLHSRHAEQWHSIIAAGEKYILSYAANHNKGAHFVDLKEYINQDLANIFDNISEGINDFFYGRYDIMCSSIDDLLLGKNFTILEYNGCGAEPNHFYDTGYSLIGAYREILKHWRWLFIISKYNAARGVKPWGFFKGRKFLRDTKQMYRMMKEADAKMD